MSHQIVEHRGDRWGEIARDGTFTARERSGPAVDVGPRRRCVEGRHPAGEELAFGGFQVM